MRANTPVDLMSMHPKIEVFKTGAVIRAWLPRLICLSTEMAQAAQLPLGTPFKLHAVTRAEGVVQIWSAASSFMSTQQISP